MTSHFTYFKTLLITQEDCISYYIDALSRLQAFSEVAREGTQNFKNL